MRHRDIELMTPTQAARIAGVTKFAIYRAIREGRLRAIIFGDGKRKARYLISPYELSLYEPNHKPLDPWLGQGFGPKKKRHEL